VRRRFAILAASLLIPAGNGWAFPGTGRNSTATQPPYSNGAWTNNWSDIAATLSSNSVQTASLGTTTTGNAIICSLQYDSSAVPTPSISNLTDTVGTNTYLRAIAHTDNFNPNMTDEIWYATNITGGAAFTVTVHFNNTVNGGAYGSCAEFSGIVGNNALDQVAFTDDSTATTLYTTVTTTSDKELLYSFVSSNGCAAINQSYVLISYSGCNPSSYFWQLKAGNYTLATSNNSTAPGYLQGNGPGATSYLVTFRTSATSAPPPLHQCLVYLTSGSSWTVPSDWNSAANTVEVIGGGGGGASYASNGGGGGGGGAYSFNANLALTAGNSVTYSVGTGGTAGNAGGDTYFNAASCAVSPVCAKGGSPGSTSTGGSGGLASAGTGTTTKNGGFGNDENTTVTKGGGGGGAGGPSAAGKPTAAGGTAVTGGHANGANGGVGGGAGAQGGRGSEWDSNYATGGGGGGGLSGANGGHGGYYGGGGGGSGMGGTGGTGGDGLIVISYQGTMCQ